MTYSNTKTALLEKTVCLPELVWQTILFNCNCHNFDDVIEQIMKAVGCSETKASQLANVADQFGSVSIYKGDREDCEHVADVLGSIGLNVKVAQ